MGEILWDKQSKFFRNLLVFNSSFYVSPFGDTCVLNSTKDSAHHR
jgi:hypothetical protein